MAIPYLSRAEERELSREIATYNRRIGQLMKQKRFQNVVLPPKLDIKSTLSEIHSGRDLQYVRNTMNRIDNPKNLVVKRNDRALQYTVAAAKQIESDIKWANARRAERRAELAEMRVIIDGHDIGSVGEVYASRLDEVYKPLKIDLKNIPHKSSFEKKFAAARKSSVKKREQLKQNILKSIDVNLGDVELVNMIQSLDLDEIEKLFYTLDELDFTFLYSLEEKTSKTEQLRASIHPYLHLDWKKRSDAYEKKHYIDGVAPWLLTK